MWYIIIQTANDIRLILLTSSKSKCKKEYERLSKEAEEEDKKRDDDYRTCFYYMGYYKRKIKGDI